MIFRYLGSEIMNLWAVFLQYHKSSLVAIRLWHNSSFLYAFCSLLIFLIFLIFPPYTIFLQYESKHLMRCQYLFPQNYSSSIHTDVGKIWIMSREMTIQREWEHPNSSSLSVLSAFWYSSPVAQRCFFLFSGCLVLQMSLERL